MTESRRPPRRGRGRRPSNETATDGGDNPYRDDAEPGATARVDTAPTPREEVVERPAPTDASDQPERPARGTRGRGTRTGRGRTPRANTAAGENAERPSSDEAPSLFTNPAPTAPPAAPAAPAPSSPPAGASSEAPPAPRREENAGGSYGGSE